MKKMLLIAVAFALFVSSIKASTHIITASNFVFSPATLTINLGDTIKWVWGAGSHTTTSETIPAGAATWNQPLNSTSTSFTYIPKVAGTYNYQCNFHVSMGMTGTITVIATCPPVTAQIKTSSNTTFCHDDSILLTSVTTGNVNSYQWDLNNAAANGQTNSTFKVAASGSYTLKVSSSCGSEATSNAIVVKVNAMPAATVTPSGTVNMCLHDSTVLTANAGTNFKYQWLKNNVAIANATQKTYTAKGAASFKVIVTSGNTGCERTSTPTKIVVISCLLETASPMPSTTVNALKIYPDPVTGNLKLTVNSATLLGSVEISIYNTSGTKVKDIISNKNENYFEQNINMSGSASGIYFVHLGNDKEQLVQKFVKE